ncbi:MAG: papain family cysteine protease [Gemmatimonadetes bacterium]|nr:papain family cysteine protease [Gemmatimonadota bacterium]
MLGACATVPGTSERFGAPSPEAFGPPSASALPARVDLAPYFPTPGDQGKQNSCVAWAAAYVRSYEERAARGPDAWGDPATVFSPAFVYNQINRGHDVGARIPDALRLVERQGIVPMAAMPYRDGDYLTRPDRGLRDLAKRWRTHGWRRVDVKDVGALRGSLGGGFPVVVAARVDSAFMRVAPGQVWSDTVARGRLGHAVVIVGYDDGRQAFKVINSWGTRWAEGGFGWIAYSLLPVIAREGYVDARAPRRPAPPARFAAGTVSGSGAEGSRYETAPGE